MRRERPSDQLREEWKVGGGGRGGGGGGAQ